jgi:hypothetical protein
MTWERKAMGTDGIDRTRIARPTRHTGIALGLVVLSLFGAPQYAAAQESDETEEAQEAQPAEAAVPPTEFRVVVDNRTAYPIDVIAYDESDGSYSPYAELPPGGALDGNVVPGELWLFEVNHQALIGQYITADQPDQYVVLDDSTLAASGYPPGPMDDSWRALEETPEPTAPDAPDPQS